MSFILTSPSSKIQWSFKNDIQTVITQMLYFYTNLYIGLLFKAVSYELHSIKVKADLG